MVKIGSKRYLLLNAGAKCIVVSIRHYATYPKFAFKIESIQQLDNVMVVAGGQNVNLHHVILQFFLCFCVNDFSSCKGPI